ncbi:MAG TPA: M23 family metallopeptidase [Actinomycetota bacterium]|nr:M23 family metallopeptidase [Actinomycetota bacterium]
MAPPLIRAGAVAAAASLLPLAGPAVLADRTPSSPAARSPEASGAAPTAAAATTAAEPPGPAYGTYAWPVEGPVIRTFDPPETPYGSGHRGIDIAAPVGTPVRAAQGGTVAFAGPVAGGLFVSIDHPDGVRTTYSWLGELSARRGDAVAKGEVVGASGGGHPGVDPPHLHFGARIGEVYIDPMLLLERGSLVGLVHLAPLEG